MSEEDVREGLRDAVVDEPPLDFDPDSLVASARRVMRRRALLAAVGATVVIAFAAVAIPGTPTRAPVRVGSSPTTTTSTTTSSPRPSVHYTAEDLNRQGKTTLTHLQRAVPRALPDASEFDYGVFGGEAAGEFSDGQNYMNAPVTFTVGGARYSIFITLWARGAPNVSHDEVCARGGAPCKEIGAQDAGPVVARTEHLGETTITSVYHFRTDGGVVQVAAYNHDMTGTSVPEYMPTIPVTLDQLRTLATDPELGL